MKKVHIYHRYKTDEIAKTVSEVTEQLEGNVEFVEENPELVVVIGGDGAMMEAARMFQTCGAEILGINRGTVGFLASVDRDQDHKKAIEKTLSGDYKVIERTLIESSVTRGSEKVFEAVALNDIVITSPLNVVELDLSVDTKPYLTMRGTGVLVSTPTGATAYNLSAHGPILMPDVSALIVTELLDHNIPTPSLVINDSQVVEVSVKEFRRHEQLQLNGGEPADVVVIADGQDVFALQPMDTITVKKSEHCSRFIEFEDYDFFGHLREKFEI